MGYPSIKNEPHQLNPPPPQMKKDAPLSLSLILVLKLQQWEKMAEIPLECDFLIQNLLWKMKQLVRKYYITWLIHLANNLYMM